MNIPLNTSPDNPCHRDWRMEKKQLSAGRQSSTVLIRPLASYQATLYQGKYWAWRAWQVLATLSPLLYYFITSLDDLNTSATYPV